MIIHDFELQNDFEIKWISELLNDAIRKTTTWSGSCANLLYFISSPITIISWHSKLNLHSVTFLFRTVPDKIHEQWRPAIRISQQYYRHFSSKWFISLISKQDFSMWPFDFTQNCQNYRHFYFYNMGAQIYGRTGMSNFDGMLLCDHTQYRFTVRLKWVKSTVSVESRVFGLNLWGGGKYFRMFSYS